MATRGKSAREIQEEIERARRHLRWRWLRPIHRFRRAIVSFATTLVGLIILTYLAMTIVHLTSGFEFGDSVTMGVNDARMIVACPKDPELVWQFINRTPLEEAAIEGTTLVTGNSIYELICKLGRFPPI